VDRLLWFGLDMWPADCDGVKDDGAIECFRIEPDGRQVLLQRIERDGTVLT
jgi:hypothetical protein